jgi:alpha-galactosidase
MKFPAKIVVVGAGSASFGENTLAALLGSKRIRGSHLVLVDNNEDKLSTTRRLAERLNKEWNAGFKIDSNRSPEPVLDGADFVICSLEVGDRENLWRKDFEIPLKYGVRQPYAENGGPGGFAHAARNLVPILEIAHSMEELCPNAWFINYTNPMIRICDAVNRLTRIKVVGLCHQIFIGYTMVGIALAKELGITIPDGITGMQADPLLAPLHLAVKNQVVPKVDIRAAGLNHFSWILSIHDRESGEDLYPIFRKRFFELDPGFEPLTRRVFSAFGLFPIPGDSHLCEYLPWVSDPVTKPWEKYHLPLYEWDIMEAVRQFENERLTSMADGDLTIDGLKDADSEGALEIIGNIVGGSTHYHLAANLPNRGQISGLEDNCIVETPVVVDGAGVHPVYMGTLPRPILELLRRETEISQLCVDAVAEGSREKAMQYLLLDPVMNDFELAELVLNDYLEVYKEYLPQFWR